MSAILQPSPLLPPTANLLIADGSARLIPDPRTGWSAYGCTPRPDERAVNLGSCTASVISPEGYAAAAQLRQRCELALRQQPEADVYATEVDRQRSELLRLRGLAGEPVSAIWAESGTDLLRLAASWLSPDRCIAVDPAETGAQVPAALTSNGAKLQTVATRYPDGSLRAITAVAANCARLVSEAALSRKRVLLVLTDLTKTGLIAPDVETIIELQSCWPDLIDVLVDACQLRLDSDTLRAYLRRGWLVAVTGSKFIGGPSFCGALLVPEAFNARYRDTAVDRAGRAASNRGDWPGGWHAADRLPDAANFGLLLRWEAALSELRAFSALPEPSVADFLRRFAENARETLAELGCFWELPVAPLDRSPVGHADGWDRIQTIIPFVPVESTPTKTLTVPFGARQTQSLYRTLQKPSRYRQGQRYLFGQPASYGKHNGEPVSAFRLAASARMAIAACRDGQEPEVMARTREGLAALAALIRTV